MTTLLGVAGREGSELTGDAATTRLRFPRDVDIARDGIVVTDSGNNRVLLVNAVGVVTTVAGTGDAGFSGDGGDAGDAELANPNGAAVEADGDILIADYDNRRIRRVSGGVISTFAGSGGYGPYGDRSGVPLLDADFKPRSVVSDGPRTYVAAPDGIWLLVDGSAIRLLDADGQQLAESPPTTAELGSPWALIVLGSREIATVDGTRNAVVRIRH